MSFRRTHCISRAALAIFSLLFVLTATLSAQSGQLIDPEDIPRGSFAIQAELPLEDEQLSLVPELTAQQLVQFAQAGEMVAIHGNEFSPLLLPMEVGESPDAFQRRRQLIADEHRQRGNNFAIEVLMGLDIPAQLLQNMDGNQLDLAIFNALHRISTLSGLEYFSASRGRMREFYLTSSVVDDDGSTVLEDPHFDRLETGADFLIRQEDASFGDNLYRVKTTAGSISIRNVSPMTYHMIRIAGSGDLEIQMRIIRSGDNMLFYAFSSLNAPKIFGLQNRLSNSFYNRIIALYGWFDRQLLLTEF